MVPADSAVSLPTFIISSHAILLKEHYHPHYTDEVIETQGDEVPYVQGQPYSMFAGLVKIGPRGALTSMSMLLTFPLPAVLALGLEFGNKVWGTRKERVSISLQFSAVFTSLASFSQSRDRKSVV